ncbi:unnamed protein product [Rhodiola kirilowii]
MASTSGTKFSDQDELRELLHEQRQELAAAALMETDFDLAYNLQLQEAIKASIGFAPSSSSSSMEQICFDTYSPIEGLSVEASVNETENDVRVLMKYMEDDVERVEQEVSDQELSEAEARRMRDDLNRRLHDQKVAAAIFAMPEEEWAKSGEYFGKPYVEGSSSDGMEVDENFRVYVKGLVSEERVRDAVVTVAGIGVAICDPSDYCILELRKPLVDGDESSKSVLSAERVGFAALVEGLKAADDLGLKRVSCFCDDNMIHQYVSTNQLSTDLKITMLAFEALTLRKKLVHFEITLVGRNEMKMASKLAKEAIVSQICIPAETIKGKKLVETCVICMEDTVVSDMFTIDGCLHRYCFSCMKQHVEVKLLNGQMAHCPHEDCDSEVPLESCKSFLEPKFVDIMIQRMKEAALHPTEKLYCPYPRCSALMSKKEIVDDSPSYIHNITSASMSKCTKCRMCFCRNCMVPWHKGMSCEDYQTSTMYKDAGDTKLKSLAHHKRWRQCVKCSNMIELAEGCYHIYCRCGYEFCYTCGAEWIDKKATCSCPLWNEPFIIRN